MVEFIRTVWGLVKPYRVRMCLGILMGVLAGLIEPLLMLVVKLAVDALFPGKEAAELLKELPSWAPQFLTKWAAQVNELYATIASKGSDAVLIFAAAIPVVIFSRGVLSYLNIYFLQWAAYRAVADLRTRVFSHFFTLPLRFFHKYSTGELMSRIVSDIGALQTVISNMTAVIVKEPFTLLALLVVLFWQNHRITLASLIILPICVVPIAIYGRKVRKTSKDIQTQLVEISQIMVESFTGARIVKAYNLEEKVQNQFAEASRKSVGQMMRLVRSMEMPGPLIEFFGAIGVAIFLIYLSRSPGIKSTPGDFIQVLGSIFLMYKPIKSLARLQNQLIQARAASERVFEMLEITSDLPEPPRPLPLRTQSADIHFDHVNFRYADALVLRDVCLTVPHGKFVALVGASGSGKTTLTNLLLRFYDPESGSVRIGGTDIRQVSSRELRDQIAVVTQEPILFNDTIKNNIRIGRPDAPDTEVVEAAKNAFAHEFIISKPEGYDSLIGEKGVSLSGGQRQRLTIARALLKNAPILVLDEATNALDAESERAVQAALDQLMKGRTSICIAHRLSTVQHADLIVVFQQGAIVETGTHQELLKMGGVYAKLYQTHFDT